MRATITRYPGTLPVPRWRDMKGDETMKQIATAMLAVGTMLAALPAAGADAICPPNPPVGSTVNGNLIVPPGATCFLNHVTVTGNVDVQPQAELNVGFDSALPQPSSTIDGNAYVGKGGVQRHLSRLDIRRQHRGQSMQYCITRARHRWR